MQVAMIGLGRMGMNMARRLLKKGHEVVAYNRTVKKTEELAGEGATAAYALEELPGLLQSPRAVWMMLPAGPAVDDHLDRLLGILSPGDIIIDGGNSFYKDDLRRAGISREAGFRYVDAGVSGGIWGLQEGYCLMVGGPRDAYDHLEPLFRSLAPEEGYLYCGESGAGHFVKMIHNGIEYAMMQAYAEGFELIEASSYGKDLAYDHLCHVWNRGSVIRSWLLELAERAFSADPGLSEIQGYVEDSGEGRWTVEHAVEAAVSSPVIALSLFERFRSRKENTFSNRVLAALRREFGGHAVKRTEQDEAKR
ncbi:MAG: decarboxylating 6-phosphogluconate dehydrogenase [Deltaproteobacteria bacterium]|nr:decarboxylating 6-phosphogluconate dehydrogenase [Deltaproteobacteria bacterium]